MDRPTADPHIPLSPFAGAADFPEAVAHRKPVTHYKPRSAAAKAVKGLADEVLARLAARTAADQGEAA